MIYEYRVYEATPGKLAQVVDLMEKAVPFFKKHGMKLIGCWTPDVGESNLRFTYILGFDNMAHLETAWQGFKTDPEWRSISAEASKNGPITAAVYNSILEELPV